jgi:hypothetical protein
MRVHGEREIFNGRSELESKRRFGNQVARFGSNDVDTEQTAGFTIAHDFNKTIGVADRERAAVGGECGDVAGSFLRRGAFTLWP